LQLARHPLGVGNLFFVKYAATRSFAIVSLSIGSNLQARKWGIAAFLSQRRQKRQAELILKSEIARTSH
jgi:hypothetical protein